VEEILIFIILCVISSFLGIDSIVLLLQSPEVFLKYHLLFILLSQGQAVFLDPVSISVSLSS
jgi:hypothetical protein